jgi:hypothetical protein
MYAVKYAIYIRVAATDADGAFAKADAIIDKAQGATPERFGLLDLLEYEDTIEQEEGA